MGLELHPDKTQLIELKGRTGFDFLGYRIVGKAHYISWKSAKKIRAKLKALTRRKSGCSVEATVEKINPILRGVYEYHKHAPRVDHMRIDKWLRMRLRSIKRKQNKSRGRGRGRDHLLYPNIYFESMGLFSLENARIRKYSVSKENH